MSSGLGRHQKAILEALATSPDCLVSDLPRALYGAGFTSKQYGNLDQALATLAQRALIERYIASVPNQWHPAHRYAMPAVRLASEASKPRRWAAVEAAEKAG